MPFRFASGFAALSATLVTTTLTLIPASVAQAADPEPPASECTVLNYAAYANPADGAADAYMFSGSCKFNVAPAGKAPVFEKIHVQIEGEWSPKLKRASEIVKLVRPEGTREFSTWATCDANPFIMGSAPVCKDRGMGGKDFAMNIRRDDAPLAKSRVNAAAVAALTARLDSRAKLRYVGLIKELILLPDQRPVGQETTARVSFVGGAAACPMEIDFGDGYVRNATSPDEATLTLGSHAYQKAGTYDVVARALPGCSGSATSKMTVTAPPSAGTPPPAPTGNGTLVAVAVGGSCTFSVNGAAKGTSSQLKLSVPPGTYSVSCKPASGAQKTRSVIIKSAETAMAMFKLQ